MNEVFERRGPRAAIPMVLVALLALVAPGCQAVTGGGSGPENVPPPVRTSVAKHERPSGRRPGVVNIDTEQALNSTRAAGTGIVMDPSGLVLTNNHVIQGATTIKGTDTDDHRSYPARIVGYDRQNDIAVVRLTGAARLKAAVFGDPTGSGVGDPVTAVGNAGGKGGAPTVVTGKITSTDQTVTARDDSDGTSERLTGMIETSAPIKPGDSGGPLLNTRGRVIGINTAASASFTVGKSKPKGTHRGYAIPADRALQIARQIARGQASATVHIGPTAMLGVKVRAGDTQGAQVVEVVPGTPADAAGVPVGAMIISLGGATVDTPTTLTGLMLAHHPGDTVRMEWFTSQGRRMATTLRLADGPPQ